MVDARIRILGDVTSAERALASLTKSNKALENQAKATGRATAAAQKTVTDGTKTSVREIDKATQAYERLESAAKSAGAAGKGGFGREQVGDISTSLGSLASVGGAFGSGAGTEALRFGGDLAGAAEYAGRFKDALKGAGDAAAASSGLVGNLATGLQAAVPGLGAAGAGLGAIAAIAAPLALGLGAIAVALGEADKQARATNEAFQTFNAQREAEREAQTLTTEEAQKALDAAKQRAADEQKIVSDNTAIYNQFYSEAQQQIPVIGDLAARFHESRGAFTALTKDTEEANAALKEANAEVAALEKILERGTTAENDRAAALEKNAKETEVAEKSLETARQQQIATLAQLKEQETALNVAYTKGVLARSTRRALEDERRKEDEALASERAQQDLDRALEQQAAAHEQNLEAIAKRGNEAILAARNDLATKEADAVKRVQQLQDEFRREEIKAEARFAKERKRELEDYRKSRKRALEDQRADELNALIENDITSIITGRSQFKTDRRREREDFRGGRSRGREDFEEERAAARIALEQKIVDIQTEVNEYRLATETKIAQIRTQTEQELALAQQAYETQLALDAEERKIQNERDAEDSRIENERRRQDRDIEDSAARASHVEALGRIEAQRLASNTALDTAIAKLNELKNIAASIQVGGSAPTLPSWMQQITKGYTPSPDSKNFYADGQSPVFDEGGIVTRPTMGKLAMNRKAEAVIPLSKLPQMMGSMGAPVNINLPAPQVVDLGGIKFVTYDQHEASIKAIGAGIQSARSQRTRR